MKNREGLSNVEIVTIVVYLLGGHTHPVDTEDVAVKANDLAPGRFVWRKHPQQINLQGVRFALEDAKKSQYGYLVGGANEGWILTEVGYSFASMNVGLLEKAELSANRKSRAEKAWIKRERQRMLSSEAYLKFQRGQGDSITLLEAASFFRIDEYVTGEMRERKLLRILNEFGDDPDLGETVKALAARVRREKSNE